MCLKSTYKTGLPIGLHMISIVSWGNFGQLYFYFGQAIGLGSGFWLS